MKRVGLVLLMSAIGLIMLVFLVTVPEAAVAVLFGWVAYLNRVLPEVVVRWDGVVVFLVGLFILTWLLHRLFTWLRREMTEVAIVWRWRSTFLVVGMVMLMFIAGIAMVGVTHQVAWLTSERQSLWAPALPKDPYARRQNLKEMGLAVHNFHEVSNGFPTRLPRKSSQVEHSWASQVLPFTLWQVEIDLQKPWDHPDNRAEARKLVPLLLNPDLVPTVLRDENGYGVSHYAGNKNLFEFQKKCSLSDISDGHANTLMIGEVASNFQPWAKPRTSRDPALGINGSPDGFGGLPGNRGALFLMVDGSVRFLSHDTAAEILEALGTPNGNEPLNESW